MPVGIPALWSSGVYPLHFLRKPLLPLGSCKGWPVYKRTTPPLVLNDFGDSLCEHDLPKNRRTVRRNRLDWASRTFRETRTIQTTTIYTWCCDNSVRCVTLDRSLGKKHLLFTIAVTSTNGVREFKLAQPVDTVSVCLPVFLEKRTDFDIQ